MRVSLRATLLLVFMAATCAAAGSAFDAWTLRHRYLLPRNMPVPLFHYIGDPSHAATPKEREAAALLVTFLGNGDRAAARAAARLCDTISEHRVGMGWASVAWLCHYFALPAQQRVRYLAGSFEGSCLVAWFEHCGLRTLRRALILFYHLKRFPISTTYDPDEGFTECAHLIDLCTARPRWEHTRRLLGTLDLRAGQTVADVGCGSGFDTYRLSRMVGPTGRVYAVETNVRHLAFVSFISRWAHLSNIELISSTYSDVGLPAGCLDCALMCSLYHNVYGANSAATRDFFMGSLWRALKPGGTLAIADNVVGMRVQSLTGQCIAPWVIIANVKSYGYRFVRFAQPCALRYVLVFRKPR